MNAEHGSQETILPISDMLCILSERIMASGKPVMVVSDLDETLANTYVFDENTNTHVPQFRPELVAAAAQLPRPLILATARPMNDPTVLHAWEQISGKFSPVVVENGGVIFHPQKSTFIQMTIGDMETFFQINPHADPKSLGELRALLPEHIDMLRECGIISDNQEVNIDVNRKTSIEIRIQDKKTKEGNPDTHKQVAMVFQNLVTDHKLQAITTGSSVSIHAPAICKGDAVMQALFKTSPLQKIHWERNDVFLITLGDNENDASLFQIADLSIGVSRHTLGLSNITCSGGELVALAALQKIVEVAK